MKKTLLILFSLVILPALADSKKKGWDPGKRREKKMKHFKKYDTNKDGKWSKKEWTAKFDKMDANKDGFISFEEKMKAHKKHRKGKKCH